jgi:transposase-like protein
MRKRKFTKEFKESIVQLVEDGTPLKKIAHNYHLQPALVRTWRAEVRELGPNAFSHSKRRRFTKDFRDSAVRRVGDGTPLHEVARDCRVDPNMLRQWRRELGANAFPKPEPRTRAMIFKLTEDEFHRLKASAKAAGARNVSAFARSRLFAETGHPFHGLA